MQSPYQAHPPKYSWLQTQRQCQSRTLTHEKTLSDCQNKKGFTIGKQTRNSYFLIYQITKCQLIHIRLLERYSHSLLQTIGHLAWVFSFFNMGNFFKSFLIFVTGPDLWRSFDQTYGTITLLKSKKFWFNCQQLDRLAHQKHQLQLNVLEWNWQPLVSKQAGKSSKCQKLGSWATWSTHPMASSSSWMVQEAEQQAISPLSINKLVAIHRPTILQRRHTSTILMHLQVRDGSAWELKARLQECITRLLASMCRRDS